MIQATKWLPVWSCFALLFMILAGCGQQAKHPQKKISIAPPSKPSTKQVSHTNAPKKTERISYRAMPHQANSIVIGLDADMTSGAAEAGEAIRRGLVLAIDRINQAGGVLGRPFELVIRDHRGNPSRGIDNIKEFSSMKHVVAVVGGIHTPVALAELPTIHKQKMIYLGPWAAGTPIVKNGYKPNYVYRVSVRDQYAGGYLVGTAKKMGHQKIGLLLEQTGWGRSNKKAMSTAIKSQSLKLAGIEWFNWGVKDLNKQIESLRQQGAQTILFVGNASEGATLIKTMAKRSKSIRLPIISHWGISSGDLYKQCVQELKEVDCQFLQTYSFFTPPFPDRAKKLTDEYFKRFSDKPSSKNSVGEIFSPVGTAHSYDLVFLLKKAIENAKSTDRAKVQKSLEQIKSYQGIIKNYNPPFQPNNHDALNVTDFNMCRYNDHGAIVPVQFKPAK